MKPFLIIGLPRSRTAWLANYFTIGETTCHHELDYNGNFDMLVSMLDPCNGNSDSSLCLYHDIIFEYQDMFNILLVARDPNIVYQSVSNIVNKDLATRIITSHVEGLGYLKKGLRNAFQVEYDELDDHLPEIHRFLLPGNPYSLERHDILRKLKITQIINGSTIAERVSSIQQPRFDKALGA